MTNALAIVLAGVLLILFVVVVWSSLVLAARADAQAEALANLLREEHE